MYLYDVYATANKSVHCYTIETELETEAAVYSVLSKIRKEWEAWEAESPDDVAFDEYAMYYIDGQNGFVLDENGVQTCFAIEFPRAIHLPDVFER